MEVQKKSWNDSSLTKVWVQKILCQYTKKQHALLVWDTFSGHMMTDVAEMLRKNNITVIVIPGGCTSKIQPIDVCLNKSFKNHCRRHWVEYMQQQVATQDPGEKIKPASKQQVIDWVVNDSLDGNKDMIRKSFPVSGISNALDGSEHHMIRCVKELTIAYGIEDTENDPVDSGSESEDPFASDIDSDHEA